MSRLKECLWDHLSVPLSPICIWSVLREKLSVLLLTPWAWFRFVDDTWVIQKQAHKQEFLEQVNKVDPAIRFIVEDNQENGAIPFLDTLVTPLAHNSLSFQVY